MVVQLKTSIGSEEVEDNKNEASAAKSSTNAASVLQAMKKRKQTSMQSAPDTLEILRKCVQNYFNEKVSLMMKDFLRDFFEPAVKNIKENTAESISDIQIQKVCHNLLDSCAKSQYSSSSNESVSSPASSSMSRNTAETNSDSDTNSETATPSLLHQALKRKRSDSETEQLFKRKFFLTTATPNQYFSTTAVSIAQSSGKAIFKTTTSQPKFITRMSTQNPGTGILTQTNAANRPIFHIIQKNLLSATHVELAHLLNNSGGVPTVTVSTTTDAASATTTSPALQTTEASKN